MEYVDGRAADENRLLRVFEQRSCYADTQVRGCENFVREQQRLVVDALVNYISRES